MDQVSDRRCTDESWIQRIALKDAISRLTPRERSILMMRFNQERPRWRFRRRSAYPRPR